MPKKYRVLIVEDEKEQAEMLGEYLHLSGPFITQWAASLQALWEALSSQKFDILLLDYKLSDGNGLEVLEELPQRGYHLPVIMITGQGDERLAVQAMQLGAADYLIKGTEDLLRLPTRVQKAIHAHELQCSVERSLEHIRYQALLLNNVRDAIVVWNTEGQISYWNPAAEALFGWSARERIGHEVKRHYLNAFQPPISEPPKEGTAGMEVERQCRTKDGRLIWVSSRVSSLRDYGAGGRLIGYMDVSRDITSRKQMEAQIQTAQRRLAQATRLAAIGELAGGVAHHINNPLTTIIAEAQILLHKLPEGHPARESAEAIEQAGWRVQQAVQHLIDFSQPAAASLESLDVNATLEKALALVGERLRAEGIRLELDLAPSLPAVRGDRRALGDLWINLLMLARHAASDGQEHTVCLRSRPVAGGFVLVEVQDDGRPIPADEMQALFEPNLLKPAGGRGSGIELSLCQEIVRLHQGRISAKSDPGHGTTFSVYLPVEVASG